MRIVCAMSGGVDSSVAAALLVEQGHEVLGLTMRLYDAAAREPTGRAGTCCSPAEIDQARNACALLGIPHYTVDERDRFEDAVIDDFVRAYAAGRTPNPCVRCNEHVKFGPLLARARALGAAALADRDPVDPRVLADLHARLVDDRARRERGRVDAQRRRPGLDHRRVITPADEAQLLAVGRVRVGQPEGPRLRPDLVLVPGAQREADPRQRRQAHGEQEVALILAVVDRAPQPAVLAARVVPGRQRRGLRVAGNEPRYVLRVLPETRAVVVGDAAALQRGALELEDFRRLAPLGEQATLRATVQVRHRGRPAPATIELRGATAPVARGA